jgi:auxin-responsive protein IAA
MRRRAAVLLVVSWPPVRSFRRNLTNGSSSKKSAKRQKEASDNARLICKNRQLVKISMDRLPLGRKVDLTSYDIYLRITIVPCIYNMN